MAIRHQTQDSGDDLAQCLLLLGQMHGVTTTEDALLSGLPRSRKRLMPSTFPRAAERLGFTTRFVQRPINELNSALFPVLLLLRDGRACLLSERSDQHLTIVFPDLPESAVRCSAEEINERYSGRAIYCRLRSPINESKVGIPGGTRRHWFWDVIKDNRSIYRDVIFAAFFINLFAVAMPLFIMNVYDRVVPNHATDTLWVLSAGVFIVFCLDLTLKMMRAWFLDLAASRADVKLSSSIMAQVLGMRMETQPGSVGAFASSVQSFEAIRAFFSSMTLVALIDLPFALLFILVIALIAPLLTVPLIVGIAFILLYALAVQSRLHKLSEEVWQASATRNGLLVESMSTIETTKSFNSEGRHQATWEKLTIFLADRGARLRTLGASVGNGAQWTQHTVAVSIVILGVYLIIGGEMSHGGLIAAYLLSSRAMAPVSQAANLLTQYFQSANSLSSLNEIMAKPLDRPRGKRWQSRPLINGKIEFRDVSLKYPEAENHALAGISFSIEAGEHVGIIGRNGSGKSSIEKLISGLYQPTSGKVLVDDANILQIDPAELRRRIGYIPQDVTLLSTTLHENITLGNPHAEHALITQAINVSGLANLINSHPDGINMQVGERGQKLSWGQRQAVAIARAVLHQPKILVFDEPTSFLDNTLEEHVKLQLKRFSSQRTLVLVTHRGSLLDLVDRLLVLEEGKLIADGPKDQVIGALQKNSAGAGP